MLAPEPNVQTNRKHSKLASTKAHVYSEAFSRLLFSKAIFLARISLRLTEEDVRSLTGSFSLSKFSLFSKFFALYQSSLPKSFWIFEIIPMSFWSLFCGKACSRVCTLVISCWSRTTPSDERKSFNRKDANLLILGALWFLSTGEVLLLYFFSWSFDLELFVFELFVVLTLSIWNFQFELFGLHSLGFGSISSWNLQLSLSFSVFVLASFGLFFLVLYDDVSDVLRFLITSVIIWYRTCG